ncbi:hypothetical protein OIE13_22820 [Streptosporangium sp. NBC_01810]|uniref:hypothetical protein n=1 Tax=Streptosporangium sp. NBC_01810 TaxID=2975951 RepID=UPI002DDC40CE|nr:hypothetical protein [Streptosporangium sp. NBC_01810]WSA23779.1 hypothetical protein OIE13_22820 [Streptosporangium sp. NBC_01810]
MSTTEAAWHRLGDLLVTRRVQLDPRYANRRLFAADTHSGKEGSWYRMITSVENGGRDNYSRETKAALERAYQLRPGSFDHSLRSGELEVLREPAMTAPAATGEGHSPSDFRKALEDLRTYATEEGKTVGEVLIDYGLDVADLVVPDALPPDPILAEIDASDISEETKATLRGLHLENRAKRFEEARLARKKLNDE